MATSSRKRMSIFGLYNDRSIRLKIFVSFLIIFTLLLVQFISSQNSLNQLEDNFDDGLQNLDEAYQSRGSNAAIRQAIQNVNQLVRIEQVRFVQYRDWLTKSTAVHETNQIDISTEIGIASDLINNLPDYVDITDGLIRLNSLSSGQSEFAVHLEEGYAIIPDKIANDIKFGLFELSESTSFQVNQILTWAITNSTDLLNNATTYNSEPLDNIQTAILLMNERANTFDDLNAFGEYKTYYNALHENLTSYYDNINASISLFNETIFSIAGTLNSTDYDNVEPIVNDLFGNMTLINEVVKNETAILDAELMMLDHHANMVTSTLNNLFTPAFNSMIAWTNEVDTVLQEEFDEVAQEVDDNIIAISENQQLTLIAILVISAFIIILVQLIINNQITDPIQTISKWSEQISRGDLSSTPSKEPMQRSDEIGKLHNNFWGMNIFLRNIIKAVRESSELITVTADDLSANTSEINSTAEEVSAIAQSMARGSTTQAEVITDIVQELQLTTEIVDNVINQINYNLRIIHDLSEQTNVLALNTAIEAANAGEFGRGFGVISESIRKMAVQSKKTTAEVTKDSSEILIQLRNTFSSISEKIENVASVSEETAASAEEVAASAEELTAVIEEISARAASLTDRSHGFEELVNRFTLSPSFDSEGNLISMTTEDNIIETEPVEEVMSKEEPKQALEMESEIEKPVEEEAKSEESKSVEDDQEAEALEKLTGIDLDSVLEESEESESDKDKDND